MSTVMMEKVVMGRVDQGLVDSERGQKWSQHLGLDGKEQGHEKHRTTGCRNEDR